MYDVIIIGAGVSGSAIARELSRFKVKACVLERSEDVCCGTSKANSGIVHAGYDAATGSLKAQLNVKGNQMMGDLAEELDFDFKRTGSLVLCFDEADRGQLEELYEQGLINGVEELQIIEQEEIRELEPNISEDAVAALYAPTAGIVCPFGLNIALAENACENGVEFHFDTEVSQITKISDGWKIETNTGTYETKCVVNAAGVYADTFHNMVSDKKINIVPRRGSYFLLDKSAGEHVSRTIFPLPDQYGKGILVTPTVHGNLLVGPTAVDIPEKEATATSKNELDMVRERSEKSVKNIPYRTVITSFAGLRAHEDEEDFVIGMVEGAPGFIDCAGIESPGLSSAPAVGMKVAGIIEKLLSLEANPEFNGRRKGILRPDSLSKEEQKQLIQEKPAYGNIICRCEMITEGEILDAIHRPLGAKSLDGVKRRTRAGMGRCQSGFCSPRTMEILSRELGIPMEEVTKAGGESTIVVGTNKDRW